MATITVGDTSLADISMFAVPQAQTFQYFSNLATNFMDTVGGYKDIFMSQLSTAFAPINYHTVAQEAAMLNIKNDSKWQLDVIVPLFEIEHIQNATPTMIRWIMANPDIRKLHLQQSCSAYDGAYQDLHPTGVGQSHYDYRRVTNGVWLEVDDGKAMQATIYEECIHSDMDQLDLQQQAAILSTWSHVSHHVGLFDKDPTSPSGATF